MKTHLMTTKFMETLRRLNACSEAVVWVRGFDTPQEAWDSCRDPNWMIWFLEGTRHPLAAEC